MRRRVAVFQIAAGFCLTAFWPTSARGADETVEAYPNYRIATIMVTFPDHPAKPTVEGTTTPWTKSSLNSFLFAGSSSMASFYNSVSGGRVTVTGEVYDHNGSWYEIPRPAAAGEGGCDWDALFDNAVAAADADIDFASYNTVFVLAPRITCSTGGKAWSVAIPNTGGTIYRSMEVDGSLDYGPQHELGHIIGMSHANVWTCDPPGILTGTHCALQEYGDRFSVMGVSRSRMLTPAAPHMENLGWLAEGDLTTVTTSNDYTIRPVEIGGTNPRYLKIPQERDAATGAVLNWYYLEYRQALGFDNIKQTPTIQELGVPNGVLVHLGSGTGTYISTKLLDMTPGSLPGHDMFDPALPLGSSYKDPVAKVAFGVLKRTATSMTIRVRFGSASLCEQRAPTIALKPSKLRGKRGSTLTATLTVTNASVLCGNQVIEVRTLSLPKGWTLTINTKKTNTVTVASGSSKTLTVRITSPHTMKAAAYGTKLEVRLHNTKTLTRTLAFPTMLTR